MDKPNKETKSSYRPYKRKMEKMNASWLKGPLPPLAESILTSGLVSKTIARSGSVSVYKTKRIRNNMKNIKETANDIPVAVSQPIPYSPNSTADTSSPSSDGAKSPDEMNNIIISANNDSKNITNNKGINDAKRVSSLMKKVDKKVCLRPSSTLNYNLLMNETNLSNKISNVKNRFINKIGSKTSNADEMSDLPFLQVQKQTSPQMGRGQNQPQPVVTTINNKYHSSNLRELTNVIIRELDANLAQLLLEETMPNASSNSSSFSDKFSVNNNNNNDCSGGKDMCNASGQIYNIEKKLKIFNYSFNEIILQEKSICSERALLLRRFMSFYNELFAEIPSIFQNVKIQESEFKECLQKSINEKEEIEKSASEKQSTICELKESLTRLEEMIKKVTEESNNKDLTISSSSFEVDYQKGQIMQLQFKLQNKKEHKKMLKNAIEQRDKESRHQLEQIESLTKVIEDFQQGETGYIQKFHQKSAELEEAKVEIDKLKNEIIKLTHIEKSDISVDTSDIPKAKNKKVTIAKESINNLQTNVNNNNFSGVSQIKSFFRPRNVPTFNVNLKNNNNNLINNNNITNNNNNNNDNNTGSWDLKDLMKPVAGGIPESNFDPQQQNNKDNIDSNKENQLSLKKEGHNSSYNSKETITLNKDNSNSNQQKLLKKSISRHATQQVIPSFSSLKKSGLDSLGGSKKNNQNNINIFGGGKMNSSNSDMLGMKNIQNMNLNGAFDFVQKASMMIQTSPRLMERIVNEEVAKAQAQIEQREREKERETKLEQKRRARQERALQNSIYHSKIEKIEFVDPKVFSGSTTKVENSDKVDKKNNENQFESKRYNIDHDKTKDIPDLLGIIMPFLSRPFIQKHITDLKLLDPNISHHIVKNEKPLVWGLQLVHNFLLDPFVRANDNQNRNSTEVIFTDWITRQYSLQHVVNQVVADFGRLLMKYRATNKMMSFFYDILEGQFTNTQLSFIGTLYSFSVQFTFPSIPESIEKMEIVEDFYIHIVVAARVFGKCFTAEVADSFLMQFAKREEPLIDFFGFLRNATEFFGDKHKQVYSQTRDLLWICGCADPMMIGFDPFVSFMTFLELDSDMRKEWKEVMNQTEEKEGNTIKTCDLMGYLADKKPQFLKLLQLVPMGKSILTMKSYSTVINDLFNDLMTRFTRLKRQITHKLSASIKESIEDDILELKTAVLCADMPKILWFYRTILLKIDKNLMKEKGFIPFNPSSNSEILRQLVEYYDRTESVAFAML